MNCNFKDYPTIQNFVAKIVEKKNELSEEDINKVINSLSTLGYSDN
jgi:hypothetical protein